MEAQVHPDLRNHRSARRARPGSFLIVLGGASLLVGLNAALLLLGLPAPVDEPGLADTHGPLMVFGFLGTLIAVERAQALRRPWAWLAPACLGAGSLLLALGVGTPWLGWLVVMDGAALFTAVYLALWIRAPLPLVAVQALSAVLLLLAACLAPLIGFSTTLPLMTGFLVLTIASERAELTPLGLRPAALASWLGLSAWLALTAVGTLAWPSVAGRLFGLGLLATTVWLLQTDAARRVVSRATGSRRFTAAALVAGYAWLGLASLVWAAGLSGTPGGHDMAVHGAFLGFGISMVMAHASIILPSVLGRPLPYRPAMWAPLVALHVGVAIRFAGDLWGATIAWQVGSVTSLVALLAFVAVAAWSAVRG